MLDDDDDDDDDQETVSDVGLTPTRSPTSPEYRDPSGNPGTSGNLGTYEPATYPGEGLFMGSTPYPSPEVEVLKDNNN